MRFRYSSSKMAKLFANSEDPNQMLHSAASDLGLHCLPITLLGSPDCNGSLLHILSKKNSANRVQLFKANDVVS